MNNKEELVLIIKNYLMTNPKNLSYEDYEKLIKTIIENNTTSKNKEKLEYNTVEDYGEYIDFNVDDRLDESKYQININKFRIEDYISEMSFNQLEDIDELKLDILFEIINNSVIVATEYNRRSEMEYKDVLKSIENTINNVKDKEGNVNLDITFEQKEYALNRLEEIIKYSIDDDIDNKDKILKRLNDYKTDSLIIASEQEIDKYDEKLQRIFKKYRFESENMENVLSRLISTYNSFSKNLDDFLDGKKADGDFQMEDSKYSILAKELAGNMEINFDILEEFNSDSEIDPLKLKRLKEELQYAETVDKGKESTLTEEEYIKLPEKIKEIYDEVTKDFDSIRQVDPSEPAIKYLKDRFPEVADILADKLEGADVLYVINNLSDYTKYEIENILENYGVEYKNFIKNLNEKTNRDNRKLENKQDEIYGKYENNLYEIYSQFSKSEKEAFFKSFILGDIDHNYVAHVIMDRLEQDIKEHENQIEKFKVEQITDREYSDEEFLKYNHEEIKLKREENIKENNSTILSWLSSVAGKDEYLIGLVNELSDVDDVEKKLNSLSKEEIRKIYNSFEANKINGYAFIHGINEYIVDSYKKNCVKCGEKIVNISDYKSDEEFSNVIKSFESKEAKEDILSLASDYIKDKKDKEVASLMHVYNEYLTTNNTNCKKIEDIQRFCKLKQVAKLWNLKQKAALEGLKVKENNNIGIKYIENEFKELGQQELTSNNSKMDILKEFARKLSKTRDEKEKKISIAVQFKDKAIYDDKNLNPDISI